MTPDFDAMARILDAAREAYDVGDDRKVRGFGRLLLVGVCDLTGDDPSKICGPVYSPRAARLQAGAVRTDRPDDSQIGRDDPAP